MFDDLDDLYQEVILEHSKRPRNFREMPNANRHARGKNPFCGDNYTVYLHMENDIVKDVSFQGDGCAISKASGSMMTEAIKGKTKAEAEKIFTHFHNMITKGEPGSDEIGKLAVLGGVAKFPTRIKCAILSWHALAAGLEKPDSEVSTEEAQKIS
jgi:nitrogen fixation protein NifU and related proteins